MAEITAALVKELRERTGIGMMECKKALVDTNGDIEVAIDNLRKSGQAKAAKKAGRVAAQGAVVTACTAGYGVMVEVNSETDFAAREENFLAFTEQLGAAVLKARTTDLDAIMQLPLNGGTVEEARQALVQKIGENIQVRRAADISATGVVGSYVHTGKIGVLVGLTGGTEELAKDVAMHVAASNPLVTTSDQVRPEVLEKEKEIIRAQPDMQGKPAEIVEKMVGGRINKFLKEVSLVDQPFVKNPDQTVAQLVKAAGADVMGFVRFEVGEGIEIVEVDFAAEVAAQVQGRA